jgi:hypothetical protein
MRAGPASDSRGPSGWLPLEPGWADFRLPLAHPAPASPRPAPVRLHLLGWPPTGPLDRPAASFSRAASGWRPRWADWRSPRSAPPIAAGATGRHARSGPSHGRLPAATMHATRCCPTHAGVAGCCYLSPPWPASKIIHALAALPREDRPGIGATYSDQGSQKTSDRTTRRLSIGSLWSNSSTVPTVD